MVGRMPDQLNDLHFDGQAETFPVRFGKRELLRQLVFFEMRHGKYDEEQLEKELGSRGLMNRLFGPK